MTLTAEYVRSRLDYDPVSGIFRWKPKEVRSAHDSRWNGRCAGEVAGAMRRQGYIAISIDDRRYFAHRIAWLYVYGQWPGEIDHRDTNRANNAIANLREATRAQNNGNASRSRNSTSGIKGVSWDRDRRKWAAYITINYRKHHLGRHETREAAATAYLLAAKSAFGEFARVG